MANNGMDFDSFKKKLATRLKKQIGEDAGVDYEDLSRSIFNEISGEILKSELTIYYEYEKHYLDLLKDYKEEIKFANTIQEDIRKERAAFFAEKLKDVSSTLKETGVESNIQNEWIKNLVESYTNSLNSASKLTEEHVINTLTTIREDEKTLINQHFNVKED